ncbi:hypothetical protein [Arsenicicoccus dermatophilus]
MAGILAPQAGTVLTSTSCRR